MTRHTHKASPALALALLSAPAAAQGVLAASSQLALAQSYIDPGSIGNSGFTSNFGAGGDFLGVQSRSYSAGGFHGSAYAEHGATFTPSNTPINGVFSSVVLDSCTSAEIFASNLSLHTTETAYGQAIGHIQFTVSAPTPWTWVGAWQGQSVASGAFHMVNGVIELWDINAGTPIVSQTMSSFNGAGGWSLPFSFGGVLNPGLYRLTWGHDSLVTGGQTAFGVSSTSVGGAPLVSCVNSTFSLVPAPGTALLALVSGSVLATRRRR